MSLPSAAQMEEGSPKPIALSVMEDVEFFENLAPTVTSGCPGGWSPIWPLPKWQPRSGQYRYQPRPGTLPKKIEYFEMCFQVRSCPQGYFCEGNSAAPKACGHGSLCNETGLKQSKPCPAGYYCPMSLLAEECYRDSFCPEGSLVPRICKKGFYCPNPCEQLPCPEGFGE
eukprot:s2469_g3.t1